MNKPSICKQLQNATGLSWRETSSGALLTMNAHTVHIVKGEDGFTVWMINRKGANKIHTGDEPVPAFRSACIWMVDEMSKLRYETDLDIKQLERMVGDG